MHITGTFRVPQGMDMRLFWVWVYGLFTLVSPVLHRWHAPHLHCGSNADEADQGCHGESQGSSLTVGTEAGKRGNLHKGPPPPPPRHPPLPGHNCWRELESHSSGMDLETARQRFGTGSERDHHSFGKRCWVATVVLLGTALGQSKFGSKSLIITTAFSRAGRG